MHQPDPVTGTLIPYLCAGLIIDREDPEKRGRIRAQIPGLMEETNWAIPKGGGAKKWGKDDVPPLGAAVFITFLNGNRDIPVWEPGEHAYEMVDGAEQPEAFPEHESPDVSVWGRGPFRLVVDNREGQRLMRLKLVREVAGVEEDICWLDFNYETNSIELYATSALGIHADAIVNIDAPTVQIRKRKIIPTTRPIR